MGIPERKKGSGRARKMNNMMVGIVKRQIAKYPTMTALDLKQTVAELATVSEQTIQQSLQKDLKMPSRHAAQKPLLTEKMKKKRMAFCKAYQHWTAEDWSKVMYSDESTFRCIRSFST